MLLHFYFSKKNSAIDRISSTKNIYLYAFFVRYVIDEIWPDSCFMAELERGFYIINLFLSVDFVVVVGIGFRQRIWLCDDKCARFYFHGKNR